MRDVPDSPFPRRFRRLLVVVLALVVTAVPPLRGDDAPSEYQVKAGLIRIFLDFMEWPASAFASEHAPLTVGVLGTDPFEGRLDQALADQTVQGRPVRIRRAARAEDLLDCQLVFVSRSERSRLAETLATLDQRPIATISEMDGFCRRGGVLNFYVEQNKVRFEANPAAAQRKSIKIGSELLKRARVVGSPLAHG